MFRVCLLVLSLSAAACGPPLPPEPVVPVEPTLPSEAELLASRPYRVVEPLDYDGGTPLPLLMALHGFGNTGAGLDAQFDLTRLAQSRGFLLVLPNGMPDSRGNRAWHPFAVAKSPFDREYLRAVLLGIKASHAVDASRVFVFGYSQGGHMAHRMGCDSADVVAGLVALAGQAATEPGACVPARPLSVLQVHGTDDEAIGYDGDATVPIDPNIPTAHETIAVWGRANGCGALLPTMRTLDLSELVDGEETTVERYADCPPEIDVELWTMNGVPHWPLPRPNFMSLLYGFLSLHPRP